MTLGALMDAAALSPQSKRFRQRLVFIDFCRHAQQLFSTKFMKVGSLVHGRQQGLEVN